MKSWIIGLGLIFMGMLVYASLRSYKKNRSADEFMMAGFGIGTVLGILTFAAALFSAFTFMGMPDFFRVHGVGAWIFLAVSDGVMVFFILWFGFHIRRKTQNLGFKGVAGLLNARFETPFAGVVYFIGIFIFMIPYVSIQIKGISIFLAASFPDLLPAWGWSLFIIIVMMVYSGIGGLKAIVYSDAIQGVVLLAVIWIIGLSCVSHFGSIENMFSQVAEVKEELLSVPGPKGLFSVQFLIVSMIAIVLIPASQPQFTSRLVVMKSMKSMHTMAVAVGAFAIIVIFPTVLIGMYGALKYGTSSTADFLAGALLFDQLPAVAGLAVVGLFAACLSTTNAQIFAMGGELRSLLKGDDKSVMKKTKLGIYVFSIIALVFSTVMGDELALLARLSFVGTSMLTPMVISAVFLDQKPPKQLIYISLFCLSGVVLSLFNVLPAKVGGLNLNLVLYLILLATSIVSVLMSLKKETTD